MKHLTQLMMVLILLLAVIGWTTVGDVANRTGSGNNVDKVINQQIEKAKSAKNPADLEKETSTKSKGGWKGQKNAPKKSGNDSAEVDYDLTNMSREMVYATVYQMMMQPNTYIGKTFRMDGLYYAGYYEPTAKHYHYCIIRDALACCTQGMEFVWKDGSHVYPDEYPKENAKIVVQGTFETYREAGENNLFCRLKEATMEVIDK